MMMTPKYIGELAKVILACEISTHPAWRGASSDDPQLLALAESMLHNGTASFSHRERSMSADAIKAAWAVYRHLKPKMVEIVEKAWHASQSSNQKFTAAEWKKMQEAIVERVFIDDDPLRYEPPAFRGPPR